MIIMNNGEITNRKINIVHSVVEINDTFLRRALNCGTRVTGQSRQRTTSLNPRPSSPGQLLQEQVLTEFKEIHQERKIEYQKAFKNYYPETLTKISGKAKEITGPLRKPQKLPNRVSYPAIRATTTTGDITGRRVDWFCSFRYYYERLFRFIMPCPFRFVCIILVGVTLICITSLMMFKNARWNWDLGHTMDLWYVYCRTNPIMQPGDHFMNAFSIVIQIRWKFDPALIQVVNKRSLCNFAHGTTSVLPWHVQNFVA